MSIRTHDRTTELQRHISGNVKLLLAMQDKRQNDLAEILDIAKSGVSSKMSHADGRRWSVEDIDAMARWFGVSVEVLYGDPAQMIVFDDRGRLLREDEVRSRWSSTPAARTRLTFGTGEPTDT